MFGGKGLDRSGLCRGLIQKRSEIFFSFFETRRLGIGRSKVNGTIAIIPPCCPRQERDPFYPIPDGRHSIP